MAIAGALFVTVFSAPASAAAEPGKAVGSFTYDGTAVTLAHATEKKVEGLFDSSKQDLLVVLTDRPLGATAADDDLNLSLRARKGDIAALMLRVDGAKLVNVSVFHKGVAGKILLPGAWFEYKAVKPGTGTLKLAPKEFDGHKYGASVEFAAMAAPVPAPVPKAAASPAPAAPAPKPAAAPLAPATTSNIDKKSANALMVEAMMAKDEHRALEVLKLGADPNGRDQHGIGMLNWAVMMCQPQVVKALIDKKADLTYQRVPGMTILAEAGACPEAAKLLRAAGAR